MNNQNICQERSGFLIRRPCNEPATVLCEPCNKYVCQKCTRIHQGKRLCITCVKSFDDYRGYHNDPYFYGHNHYNGWGRYDRSYSSSGSGGSGSAAEASCGGGDEADIGDAAAVAAVSEAGCGGGDEAGPQENEMAVASEEAGCGGGDEFDSNDFTEADGEALADFGDEGFETDVEGS